MKTETHVYIVCGAIAWSLAILWTLVRVALAHPGDDRFTIAAALLLVILTVISARRFAQFMFKYDQS